jgi:hypothetical protein
MTMKSNKPQILKRDPNGLFFCTHLFKYKQITSLHIPFFTKRSTIFAVFNDLYHFLTFSYFA